VNTPEALLKQYLGYKSTPQLWHDDLVYGFNQFQYETIFNNLQLAFNNIPNRLGKRVEHFVYHDLQQHPDIQLLAHNLQIQVDKQTIGELDALLLVAGKPIHLEIVYKFYLYDPDVGITELDHWIGPNRNDSLVQKLEKLKTKQFALLHRKECAHYLESLGLQAQDIEQHVLFKAQLYVPKSFKFNDISSLNTDCIMGTYIKKEVLPTLSDCQFYMPSKLDWLVEPHHAVQWQTHNDIESQLTVFLNNHQSPLLWIQHPNQSLERCFIIWW
jgi:hypothetical protein